MKAVFFFSDWQWNELPLYVHLQGQSMQIAFAIVTSKGLHVSKGSNVFRHEGGWMSTLSGELFREEMDEILQERNNITL